jgi:hypothetical protein
MVSTRFVVPTTELDVESAYLCDPGIAFSVFGCLDLFVIIYTPHLVYLLEQFAFRDSFQ